MKNNKKKKNKKARLKSLKHELMGLFFGEPTKFYAYRTLHKEIGVKKYSKEDILDALEQLWRNNKVVQNKGNKFGLAPTELAQKKRKEQEKERTNRRKKSVDNSKTAEGIVDMTSTGSAYIIVDGLENDVFIPLSKINKAFDKDKVRIKYTTRNKSQKLEGEIIDVIERNKVNFVGILKLSQKFAFLIPDQKMSVDLFIPLKLTHGAKDGEKVVVKIKRWSDKEKSPVGEVVERLGTPGTNDVEMQSILANKGFALTFPDKVLAQGEKLVMEIPAEEIAKRRDFRKVTTFTIDPADAKDFDDALSFRELENGNWEIGVHIADVTHYVPAKTPMDKEAFDRSTSVYLVDRVFPMFPEHLSNKVCSLRPHEEKLCFAAVFEIDKNATVLQEWFGRTVIYSDRRFTYDEAQAVLESGEGDMNKELLILNDLAKKLKAERNKLGSINFNSEEVEFKLDDNGKPIAVYLKVMKEANKLIEEFMLLANKKVAAFINSKKFHGRSVPSVNRIHAEPDMEKLMTFRRFAASLGHKVVIDNVDSIASELNKLMDTIQGTPAEAVLSTLAIRSMSKAAYSTDNIGHYGLAFKDYVHFTSPIRRYPDVMIHRILTECLAENPKYNMDDAALEARCQHASMQERKALEAERDSTKYKQVEYMEQYVGDIFEGVISGVTSFGFFVELTETKCEGLVKADTLIDDYYEFDEYKYALIGKNKGRKYQLGDPVRVAVVATDLDARNIDLELMGKLKK